MRTPAKFSKGTETLFLNLLFIFFFPLFLRLHNVYTTLFELGSGLLNSRVHDHVLVVQELFAVQSSSGDTDSSLEIHISLTVL